MEAGGGSGGSGGAAGAGAVFRVRRVGFRGRAAPVVMQSENGPCPLLGVVNALLLRGALSLRGSEATEVYLEALLALVAGRLLDANARAMDEGADHAENQRRNVSDSISLLPKLATGVDVNPIFRSPQAFEFTDEIAIFDMLDLGVVHGWVVDPACAGAAEVAPLSYNRLMERVIELRSAAAEGGGGGGAAGGGNGGGGGDGAEEGDAGAGAAALATLEEFMASSPSQLTVHGLQQLHDALKPNELAVFFRNNHFSTILKHDGHIYSLVTDQGYIAEPRAVWERLSSIDGNTQYVDEDFKVAGASSVQFAGEAAWADDAAVQAAQLLSKAASLNERLGGPGSPGGERQAGPPGTTAIGRAQEAETVAGKPPRSPPSLGHHQGPDADADFALALQLQEQYKEEERRMAAQHAREAQRAADRADEAAPRRHGGGRGTDGAEMDSDPQRRRRNDKCTIM